MDIEQYINQQAEWIIKNAEATSETHNEFSVIGGVIQNLTQYLIDTLDPH